MNKNTQSQNHIWIEKLKKIVLELFKNENIKIILFGSRVEGKSNTASDIDIGLIPKGKIDKKKIVLLREYVEESNIPYKVDILDFSEVSEEFKKEALKKVEIWKD